MQTYLELKEFCKLVHLDEEVVLTMIEKGSLKHKKEDDKILIEASTGTFALMPNTNSIQTSQQQITGNFVEKTIGTILNLHEKVLDAKDETLEVLKNENAFLKEALYSVQELYDADRKVIESLNAELTASREEIEFLKRKYKLMWNKAVENYKK
ncbi:DUF3972 domain-containing protein [Campylobacter canadensis]|uniref:DUF3972 domain-containing protein n=1 Tax=Campylobacter canadensis TaxID=449520 RepID=A0ABS7WW57_9BACT|nr:DUF3972 domain-containing protein [Campylobacter canadensis]MBZ7988149.1 DUF3972 domain-containing protein [Campylobacter canadensis]MBZ7995599.1 DUF3972 domain-containing protein [Campylobacter canadensis]MBZ7997396.1 DUF3972 domain-containing protein [Campylobacter canadensis]MBZ7999130.1 DUF3972 domain-containing protein [Campylobacter canadensis]MBZ8000932.1 DUF3972 domain-containing protein [Campylobacter canadensis]